MLGRCRTESDDGRGPHLIFRKIKKLKNTKT